MDPITAMLLGALILTGCAKVGLAATSDAITTARASKAGQWDWLSQDRERRAASRKAWAKAWAERRRRRHEAAGGDGEFRPGAREYAGDLYHGWWEDRLERRTAKRAARPEYVYDPDRPSLAQRFDAAVLAKVERAREVWGQRRPESVEDAPADDLFDQESLPVLEPVVHDPGTWTVGGGGERVELAPGVVPVTDVPLPRRMTAAEMRAEWQELTAVAEEALDRGDWAAAVDALDEMEARYPSVYRTSGLRSTDTNAGTSWTGSLEHVRAKAALELQRQANGQAATISDTTNGGTLMSAPTGEAVNFETTVAELEALAEGQRGHIDHCNAALASIEQAKASINNMQESYRASAAAASSMAEHLTARNLDGVTLANAGTTADAMPAGVVDAMYDQLEQMEAEAQARLADAEVALGATEANLTHVQATYGDAHTTVAGNLGGDASFLDAGGGVTTGSATPAPVASAQPVNS